MFDLVVFDCDGVLINSETVYLEVELSLLDEWGATFDRADYARRMLGLSEPDWWDRIGVEVLDQTGNPIPDGAEAELDRRYRDGLERSLAPLPDVHATVEALELPSCVASSSSTARLEWKLKHTGLFDLFAPHVYSADIVDNGKPAPDLFLHAASRFDAPGGRCLVVEDSVNGVRAGKAAGMSVIGLTAGEHCLDGHGDALHAAGADWVVGSFAEIGRIAGQRSAD